MPLRNDYLRLLLGSFEDAWKALMLDWIAHGKAQQAAKWMAMERAARTLLQWSDFDAYARLLHRAIGERVKIPAGEQGKPPTISMVVGANDGYAEHAQITNPIAAWRAKEWAKVERQYVSGLAKRRKLLRQNKELTDRLLAYRMRRFRREQFGEIASVSEQVTLSVPEIGEKFPFAAYHTRDDWRVRPTHAAMAGFVAQRTNEIWRWVRPLSGFGCRCYLIQIHLDDAKKRSFLRNGSPKFEVKWPNDVARANYERGIPFHGVEDAHAVPRELRNPLSVFPDPGIWMMPRLVSFDPELAPVAEAAAK